MNELVMSWEWERKKNEWISYDNSTNLKLNSAFQEKENCAEQEKQQQRVISLNFDGSELTVDAESMTQKNNTTGFSRFVRCCVHSSDDDERYAWEWQDARKRWHSYGPMAVKQLEIAFAENKQSGEKEQKEVNVNGDHLVNLQDMTDNSTGKIRRVLSSAERSIVASPAPPAILTRSMNKKRSVAESGSQNSNDTNGKKSEKIKKRQKVDISPKEDVAEQKEQKDSAGKNGATANSKPAGGKGKRKQEKLPETDSKNSYEEKKCKILVKGRAPVDSKCARKVCVAHVYCEGNDVYSVTLNQTNVQDNNNKYYIIQLLEDDTIKRYSVWLRWGRVGLDGQNNLIECGADLEMAKRTFCQKFQNKTRNRWADRHQFNKVAGKYDLLEMDYSTGEKSENDDDDTKKAKKGKEKKKNKRSEKAAKIEPPESKLDPKVKRLLQLICDIRAMEQTVAEMEYDAGRAPLGKITKTQIKGGYEALKTVEACIEARDFGRKLLEAVNDYYTKIPHSFGMRQPPLIKTLEQLRQEVQLLETLGEIEVAIRALNEAPGGSEQVNPIDRHYMSMKCSLSPLSPTDNMYQLVAKYLSSTHGPTHNIYKMKLHNVFEVDRDGERERFKADLGNRRLLWHGSRLTNWYGILSQGLRVAPPEAPITGYMFGKGIYFADISSKSANYCFANSTNPTGLIVLCEVALGTSRELLEADYKADRLPKGCNSTFGIGQLTPSPKNDIILDDGCTIPCGEPIKRKKSQSMATTDTSYVLNYNEYVVYDPTQVRVRYLVEVGFEF